MNGTQRLILEAIRSYQPVWKYDLAVKTGLPRTTVYNTVDRLELLGLVKKVKAPDKVRSAGPDRVYYRLTKAGEQKIEEKNTDE